MNNKLCLITLLIAIIINESSSLTNIECNFGISSFSYTIIGYVYHCEISKNPNIITQDSTYINSVYGAHDVSKTNNDVLALYANQKTIKYFPLNLHDFFKNIKGIHFDPAQLTEIHQSDLKNFPDLVYFDLVYNSIEVIEEGLFDFNPNLQFVRFYESKIVHIDPNVFDHLSYLEHLHFHTVPCINQNSGGSRNKVLDAIKIVKAKCTNSEYLDMEQKIKNLENDSKILNIEAFNQKFENFEKIFKNSKFSKFRPLKGKFEDLKMSTGCSNCAQISKISEIDMKLNQISQSLISSDLKNISGRFNDLFLQCDGKMDVNYIQDSLMGYLSESNEKLNKKLEGIEDNLKNFEAKIEEKMDKELANIRHKIDLNFYEKLKAIEKRLMKKFEDVLEEKLEKVLKNKLEI